MINTQGFTLYEYTRVTCNCIVRACMINIALDGLFDLAVLLCLELSLNHVQYERGKSAKSK